MAEVTALDERIAWMEEGTALLLRALADLSDDDLSGPSGLPGWSLRHVAAHVGYNARALSRLAHWARTGEKTPMYSSGEARAAEIEQGAALPAGELRALVAESAERLRADLAALPADRWEAKVATAQGRTVPATEIVWMRCREVWVHAVDLGADFSDVPAAVVDALALDVLSMWERRGEGADIALAPADRPAGWPGRPVPGAGQEPVVVRGDAAGLTGWLTGRSAPPAPAGEEGTSLPSLPRWL